MNTIKFVKKIEVSSSEFDDWGISKNFELGWFLIDTKTIRPAHEPGEGFADEIIYIFRHEDPNAEPYSYPK